MALKKETVNTQRGFTLLETTVAFFVLIVGIGGVFGFLIQTIVAVSDPIGQLEAPYLAQEGIEIVRAIRDTNLARIEAAQSVTWLDGLEGCTEAAGGCEADYKSETLSSNLNQNLFRNSDGFYDYDPTGQATSFQRTIVVEPDPGPDPKRAKVVVQVAWEFRGTSRGISATTYIYNTLE